MAKPGLFISDVKINFRVRDFFLDFMACLVPGLIFLISITVIVGGTMIIILFDERIITLVEVLLKPQTNVNIFNMITGMFSSFSFNFWLIVLITILSYFAGHLLYRQTPKVPDFASFLRIRKKVIKTKQEKNKTRKKNDEEKDDWVIERGKGIKSREVQFPYSNLKSYLENRGFHHLTKFIKWSTETGNRSKTVINRAKIRVAYFFPEHTMNIIRNEAHIRLASSMWYAAKYIQRASYITIFALIVFIYKISCPLDWKEKSFLPVILLLLLAGYLFREIASYLMDDFPDDNKNEDKAMKTARRVDTLWRVHDMFPLVCNILLIFGITFMEILSNNTRKELILIFLSIQAFILVGSLFAKYRIEETIHYQRVREIVYVLETAYLSHVLGKEFLPNPLQSEKLSHDIILSKANIDLNLQLK